MATAKTTVKKSSDKTFYREEDQEITYVRHRSAINDKEVDSLIKGKAELTEDAQWDDFTDPLSKFGLRITNHKSDVRIREPIRRRSCATKWKVILVVLLLLAALAAGFLYFYVI